VVREVVVVKSRERTGLLGRYPEHPRPPRSAQLVPKGVVFGVELVLLYHRSPPSHRRRARTLPGGAEGSAPPVCSELRIHTVRSARVRACRAAHRRGRAAPSCLRLNDPTRSAWPSVPRRVPLLSPSRTGWSLRL